MEHRRLSPYLFSADESFYLPSINIAAKVLRPSDISSEGTAKLNVILQSTLLFIYLLLSKEPNKQRKM